MKYAAQEGPFNPLYFREDPLGRLGLGFLGQRGDEIRVRILELSSTSSQFSGTIINARSSSLIEKLTRSDWSLQFD